MWEPGLPLLCQSEAELNVTESLQGSVHRSALFPPFAQRDKVFSCCVDSSLEGAALRERQALLTNHVLGKSIYFLFLFPQVGDIYMTSYLGLSGLSPHLECGPCDGNNYTFQL